MEPNVLRNDSTVVPLNPIRRSGEHRRAWLWAILSLVALAVAGIAVLTAVVPLSSGTVRQRIVATLSDRMDSDVSLEDLRFQVFPRLHAEGKGLVVRRRGQQDYPPLITIKRFSVTGNLLGVRRKHVQHVELEGLDIEIPPDDHKDDHHDDSVASLIVIDTLTSTNARLALISSKKDKPPKVWEIHDLKMRNVGVETGMPFTATLTNAIPPGQIQTSGSFGPWVKDAPGDTPINGTFRFDRADLSVFKGLSGILSSRGSFAGSLGWIDINGETDTPDFTIKVGGHPFALHTKYHSVVDGTNGDTRLERIDGTFLNTLLVAKGAVLDAPKGVHGRTVSLDVQMDKARIEDIMTMAVKTAKPPMTGALKLTTKFLLPPGEDDVSERLRLDGRFAIIDALFTDAGVQAKIIELSQRGRGHLAGDKKENIPSDFEGQFKLADGTLRIPRVQFMVPGATVQLAGTYALKPELIDFRGTLYVDAKISQMTKGITSLLLKIVDPLFKREGGGSAIPIKVNGPRKEPKFGLDTGRLFKRDL